MKHKFENVNPETPCNDILMKLRKTNHPYEANVNLRHAQAYKLSKVSTQEGQNHHSKHSSYSFSNDFGYMFQTEPIHHRAPYKSK